MSIPQLENAAPKVFKTKERRNETVLSAYDDAVEDPIDAAEIFDHIRDINDPEHPYSLEQLNVVQEELIEVDTTGRDPYVRVSFTPTIPHCSMATLIGLAILVKLSRSLHSGVKVRVHITPGTHQSESSINRQLADKERVAAAMENSNLMTAVNNCLRPRE